MRFEFPVLEFKCRTFPRSELVGVEAESLLYVYYGWDDAVRVGGVLMELLDYMKKTALKHRCAAVCLAAEHDFPELTCLDVDGEVTYSEVMWAITARELEELVSKAKRRAENIIRRALARCGRGVLHVEVCETTGDWDIEYKLDVDKLILILYVNLFTYAPRNKARECAACIVEELRKSGVEVAVWTPPAECEKSRS